MSKQKIDDEPLMSIIIPAYNEEQTIVKQIQNLAECSLGFPTEIIVVDGGSTDQTVRKVREIDFTCLVTQSKGRAVQMNAGADYSSGSILYFVHADSKPPDSFQNDIRKALKNGEQAGCYRFTFDSDHLLPKLNSFFTRFDRLMCRGGDQTLFVTRGLFYELNGFKNDYKIMEDFEFIRRLRKREPFTIIQKDTVVSARKYDHNSYLKVNLVNFVVFMMFFFGASQEAMIHAYKQLIANTKFG
ncbi:TIGR04283 family arsenosugar biosynthesis glycosyltransferase [Rhodohalobacter sp. 8-1]|uniref:TIGR04283 family arsenosugar biosynthesis glycosyltransferase n=1 Tax=Rhodohalobacter sp. 8-1 TaxID=3131972 RepID=UPI0030EF21CF